MRKAFLIFTLIASFYLLPLGNAFSDEPQSDVEKLVNALNELYNLNITVDDVVKLLQQKLGFSQIAKVYILSVKSGKSANEILELKKNLSGWGEVINSLNLSITAQDLAKEAINVIKKAGIEEHGEGQGSQGGEKEGNGEKHQYGKKD